MQLVTDLYYCGFVVFRVIAFTEQAHPFVVACLLVFFALGLYYK